MGLALGLPEPLSGVLPDALADDAGALDVLAASSVLPEHAVRARSPATPAAIRAADVRRVMGQSVRRHPGPMPVGTATSNLGSQPVPRARPGTNGYGAATLMVMTRRTASRWLTLASAIIALFAVTAAPVTAKASETALRERTHARIVAVMDNAISSGLYSDSQGTYVSVALLPASVDPKTLPVKSEERTIDAFWDIVADGAGISVGSVQARLANGASLLRISGDASGDVQDRLYRWLSRPVVEAQFDGKVSMAESVELRDDIARAVDRLMRQPGGSDGRVVISPRRN